MSSNETVSSNPNSVSRIAAGMTVIKGEIVSLHDIRFDGDFDGKISSKGRIIIGETSHIKAEIICSNLDIWGSFEGTACVKDTLALKSSCKVKGDMMMSKFVADLGAVFNGVSKMITEEEFDKMNQNVEYAKSPEKTGNAR